MFEVMGPRMVQPGPRERNVVGGGLGLSRRLDSYNSDADGGWFDVLARASPTVHGGLPHPPEWAVKLCKYHSDRVGFRCGNIAAAVLIPRNAAPATLGCSLL